MNRLYLTAVLCLIFSSVNASAQNKTYFQKIAGNWEGTLEYLDYQENKRVKLKTYLTVTPAPDGNSAEVLTIYDDFGRIIKDTETVKIDRAARQYAAGDYRYTIESIADGKIVLLGSGQDGEKVEPIRKTITFDENSLEFLKETRTPWQFRNRTTLKRRNESVLAKRLLTAAQMKEDFDVLRKTLTTLHPGIYRYQTTESLEKVFGELKSKIKNPLPESEFFLLVSQLSNQIYCGHTYANPYNQNGILREKLFNGAAYLPFYFRIIAGKFVVTEDASANSLSKGSEITKINGVSAKAIIEKLSTVTKGDGRNNVGNRLQSIELTRFEAERYALFDWYFPLFFPLKDEIFTIEAIDFATKKLLRFQVPAVTKETRTAEMAKRYGTPPTYDDGWKFEIQNDSTGYLKIDNSITWRLKTIKFKEFLANAFAELRAKNVKNLIIDWRGNGGGDTDIGFELAQYLAKKNLPPYLLSRRLVRTVMPQISLAEYLDTYSKELKSVVQSGLPANTYQKVEDGYFEISPNESTTSYPPVVPDANNFQGRTFIVSDASNASAAFQFLDYAQKNKLGMIVGQATGGSKQGINGGNYFFLRLPNSSIEIDVPVYFIAPLTAQKDESVVPDVAVRRQPADIGNRFDRELMTIKKLIARK